MTESSTEVVTVEADGPLRVLTLNRPERHNAVNAAMHHRLSTIWAELAADTDARVVVLTGAGTAFSAGGEYDYMQTLGDAEARWAAMEEGRRIITGMLQFPLPVIAAVNGPAVGLGASLAMMCDLVVMADTAHLADPHVAVGLVAGDGGAASWPANASMLHVKEFLFLGDPVPADRAIAMGLANRVVPAAELGATARALATRLADLPQHALRDTKRALNLSIEQNLSATRNYALAAQRFSLGDVDHQQFLERYGAKLARRGSS